MEDNELNTVSEPLPESALVYDDLVVESTTDEDSDGSLVGGMILGIGATLAGFAGIKYGRQLKDRLAEKRERKILDMATAIDAKYKAQDEAEENEVQNEGPSKNKK